MRIAITGASGFVGTHLRERFRDHVVIERKDGVEDVLSKLDGVDVVVNLAGAPIIRRWSDPYKEVLVKSRIQTTEKVVRAVNQSGVRQLVSTSAIGIYPDGRTCDETCPELGTDFLARLARDWEEKAMECAKPVCILRFGVVLGTEGGALRQMLTPFRLGLGGPIGDGRMMTSWIDVEDLMNIYSFVMERGLSGVFNAVSPNPVSNRELTRALARVLRRPAFLPVPRFVLKLMYGEAADVLTASKIVYPKRLLDEGFEFEYEEIERSLRHLLS